MGETSAENGFEEKQADQAETAFKDRITRQGEEVIGRIAEDLLKSPLVSGAITAAFDARERAARAQELAMGALNLPSAADLERLTRRLRSVSQRIESLEDAVDRIAERPAGAQDVAALDQRLVAIEQALTRLEQKLG